MSRSILAGFKGFKLLSIIYICLYKTIKKMLVLEENGNNEKHYLGVSL